MFKNNGEINSKTSVLANSQVLCKILLFKLQLCHIEVFLFGHRYGVVFMDHAYSVN